MKKLVLLLSFLIGFNVFAKGPETEMVYVVPVSEPSVVPNSRFIVPIVSPYKGPETQKISYQFPEVLTGSTGGKLIEFNRIPDTPNSWVSKELTANCAEVLDQFSCNIHVNKNQNEISLEKSLNHLDSMGLDSAELEKFKAVVNKFYADSGEPVGFFSYEFDAE